MTPTTKPLVGYVRVSTATQGRSGLGIEAQRQALERFAHSEGYELARVFVEIETGKGSDALERRPQLSNALAEARRKRCSVAVAKLDRLSRDVHFISGLMAHRVPVLGRRAWLGRRSVHPAPLRRACREGAGNDQRTHEGSIRSS